MILRPIGLAMHLLIDGALGGGSRLIYAGVMRILRRALVLLTVLALVTGSFTVSMASVMDAVMAAPAATQADAGDRSMPDCTDCGRVAVLGGACAAPCFLPPADLAAAVFLAAPPAAVPSASPFLIRVGRLPAPEPHPPRPIA